MRFVPVLPEFITGPGDMAGIAFSGPSWLYCRDEFSYQATIECHAPAVFRTERAD